MAQLEAKSFLPQIAEAEIDHQTHEHGDRRRIGSAAERNDEAARVTLAQVVEET